MFTPKGCVSGRGTYVDEKGIDRGPGEKFVKLPLPVGKPVWVREAWSIEAAGGYQGADGVGEWDYAVQYKAGGPDLALRHVGRFDADPYVRLYDTQRGDWRSPVTMPRWASRLTLVASEARVCRVQDVTEDEAYRAGIDEERCCGVPTDSCGTHLGGCCGQPLVVDLIDAFRAQWTADHGPDSWSANPWVQIARVAVHHCNIEKLKAEEDAA